MFGNFGNFSKAVLSGRKWYIVKTKAISMSLKRNRKFLVKVSCPMPTNLLKCKRCKLCLPVFLDEITPEPTTSVKYPPSVEQNVGSR